MNNFKINATGVFVRQNDNKIFRASIKASEIAKYIGKELIGDEIKVEGIGDIDSTGQYLLKFLVDNKRLELESINNQKTCLLITTKEYEGKIHVPHIISENPKYDFCRAAGNFFPIEYKVGIEKTAMISDSASIGREVYIGNNVVIGENVQIGDRTRIMHNCVIVGKASIGADCLIKSGTIIGERGFGFSKGLDGIPIQFPHIGKLIIGNYVEIGALNTIAIGALSDTTIGDFVKTDDHVHIAHNVKIGKSTLITACTEISGSVTIGANVWVGPNSSINNGVMVDDGAFIGIGAVVTKNVGAGVRVAGNPARRLSTHTD